MRIPSRLTSARSALSSLATRRGGDRPHWSARLEDVKNAAVGRALRQLRWDLRLQPFHGFGSTERVRVLAKVLHASPGTPADFHDQPVHDLRTMAVRGWRNFAGQVAPHRTVHVLLGDQQFTVRADRAGIVDATLEVSLAPSNTSNEARTAPRIAGDRRRNPRGAPLLQRLPADPAPPAADEPGPQDAPDQTRVGSTEIGGVVVTEVSTEVGVRGVGDPSSRREPTASTSSSPSRSTTLPPPRSGSGTTIDETAMDVSGGP